MTLNQMKYFQSVCKTQNFTKAASEMHISQPAMSSAMRELEEECGVPLFIRDKNSVRITDEGWVLFEEVNSVLIQKEKLEHIVKELSLSRKYVRIGVSTLSGNQVYPEILCKFQKMYPDIQVISTEESTSKQFELLDEGFLDVAITVRYFSDKDEQRKFDQIYAHWPMIESRLLFCVSKNNRLSSESYVTMEQISKEPLILLNDSFGQTVRIKQQMADRGLKYEVIHYTKQMYTVERFIEKNVASGFLPDTVAENNPNIIGIPYDAGLSYTKVELFWRKDKYLFSSAKKFIAIVKSMYPKRE